MVRQVSFEGIDYASWDNNYDEDPSDIFDPLVELLDNRTVITLSKLSQYYDIDHAIFSAQTKFAGKAAPLFRRVFNARPNDHEEDRFESAYEGYQTDRYPWYPEYEKLLHGSFDTLTRLDIHFASFTPLTQFHRLERLTLRLNDVLETKHENIGVDRDLVTLLPTLTSLRFLILTNTTDVSFDPTYLLESGSLAESLPPNLTQLSLDLVLESSQVLVFLQRLPQATTLQKLNYRWRSDENQGVVGECRTRGIELRLNQKWEIW